MCDKFDLHSKQVLKNPTTFLHQLSPINWLTRKVLIGQTSPDPVQITDHNPITTEFGSIYKYQETGWAPTCYQLEVICIQKMPIKFFNIMWGIESVLWLRINLSGEEPLTTHLLGENPELVSEFNPLREQE